jgi:DNA (cytosine-5)-methyltransferase 1
MTSIAVPVIRPRDLPEHPVLLRKPGMEHCWLDPRPTAISLFSGLGSFSKALRDLGFHVLAHDFMPEACATLRSNGFDVIQGDVRDVDFSTARYGQVEVIIGGPPCQPFSQGGRNGGQYDERDMLPDFTRAVAEIQPRFFMMENVRGLASPRHKAYLDKVLTDLEALGYIVEWDVLDASDYGVPQSRKRTFVMGVRVDVAEDRERTSTPWPIHWPTKVRTKVTMATALGWTAGDCYARNQAAPEAARVTGKGAECYWPLSRPSTTVVGSFRPDVQAAPGYRSTGDGPRQNAKGSVVTTTGERLLLQQMPVDWTVCGSKAKVDLQIGNSCPNGLVKALLAPNVR